MAEQKKTKKMVVRKTVGRATKERIPKAPVVQIDFPREGDQIPNGGHYAVRIGAAPNAKVELSFDNKKWFSCREAVGFYWFDWSPEKSAQLTLIARVKNGSRPVRRSLPRKVKIVD